MKLFLTEERRLLMPTVKPNEDKNKFISRCVKQMMHEGKTQQQSLGACYGMWRQHKRKGIAKAVKS